MKTDDLVMWIVDNPGWACLAGSGACFSIAALILGGPVVMLAVIGFFLFVASFIYAINL
jgi:hypothetical protein